MSLSKQQEYWNGRYSAEGAIWGENPCLAATRAAGVFRANGARKILVPGCGYGRNSSYLAVQGFQVSAFDISDEAIKLAKEMAEGKTLPVEYRQADVLEVEIRDTFDGILSINMLHLFDEQNREKILQKFQAVLKEGGILVLTSMSVNDPDFGKGEMVGPNTYESKKGRPIYYFDAKSIDELFSKYFSEFEVEEIREYENHGGKEHYHNMMYVVARK